LNTLPYQLIASQTIRVFDHDLEADPGSKRRFIIIEGTQLFVARQPEGFHAGYSEQKHDNGQIHG
jgi:hypothetical protein